MSVVIDWPWPDPPTICSCGEPGCKELGWGHDWDPVACGDSCVLLCGGFIGLGDEYARYGCGYAHVECIEVAG